MRAILNNGTIVEIPDTPAISQAVLSSALVFKSANVLVVYDQDQKLGAALTLGEPYWHCWTPITREEFIDKVILTADEINILNDAIQKH